MNRTLKALQSRLVELELEYGRVEAKISKEKERIRRDTRERLQVGMTVQDDYGSQYRVTDIKRIGEPSPTLLLKGNPRLVSGKFGASSRRIYGMVHIVDEERP